MSWGTHRCDGSYSLRRAASVWRISACSVLLLVEEGSEVFSRRSFAGLFGFHDSGYGAHELGIERAAFDMRIVRFELFRGA